MIAGAIALCSFLWNPVLYVLAVIFIGARQHALLVLGHDASHFRTLPTRWQNDLFANLFLMWPTFASVEGFRKFHGTHHQYINLPDDGNRHIWRTHDAAGELAPDWQFPKTRAGLVLVLLRRAAFLTGMLWIVRGLVGMFLIASPRWMLATQLAFYGAVVAALTYFGAWYAFLLVLDRALLHLAHRRAVHAADLRAQRRRERRGRLFHDAHDGTDLPRVGLHPAAQYRLSPRASLVSERAVLPLAGASPALMEREGFRQHAVVKRSVIASLSECVRESAALRAKEARARA